MAGVEEERILEVVRHHYTRQAAAAGAACCGEGAFAEGQCCCQPGDCGQGYRPEEVDWLPPEALRASLGCGNPVALAELKPGEVVLDLGSGGGIDVLLSARRVGPTGLAYGLDMTEEMLALAEENRRRAGVPNVRFLKGRMEDIPLPEASVDVILSNCVVNLSPDKDAVFAQAFRVLRPGGRLAIADVVRTSGPPPDPGEGLEGWVACLAGALTVAELEVRLARAGFEEISVELLGPAPDGVQPGSVASAFLRARKPGAGPDG